LIAGRGAVSAAVKELPMEDLAKGTSATNSVRALLEGGPKSIPNTLRTQQVGPADQTIKVPHRGGYEHFERVSEANGPISLQRIVFHWTMRTEMAE
jgi:hypothetical protein